MQNDRYPFIDLAVHEAIRERFAEGDALIVASPDLRTIFWANGQASELFGYSDIYELLEDGIESQPALKRQIAGAIVGLARKAEQDFMIRVSHGFRRMAVGARAELIELPGGAAAVLVSSDGAYVGRTDEARGKQIISGFEGTDTHVAVLNANGKLVAGSPSFIEADIDSGDLAKMVQDVAGEKDRLVKRMVKTSRGAIAAAIGQLTDDPVLHLVFAIEPAAEQTGEVNDTAEIETGAGVTIVPTPFDAERIRDELDKQIPRAETVIDDELPITFRDARDIGSDDGDQSLESGDGFGDEDLFPAAFIDDGESDNDTADQPAEDATDAVSAELENTDPRAVETASEDAFIFDPSARPIRFVWKIDREGAFSEVSPEFASAVGPNAADIIGRRFPDIARVFNLDPNNEVSELLNRRDTWSGKTVNWPVQGTDLVVPVDLAALPTYTRERRFDGFRGFGIVRLGEAHSDDQAIGLALTPGPWTGRLQPEQKNNPEDAAIAAADIPSETVEAGIGTTAEPDADSPIQAFDDGSANLIGDTTEPGGENESFVDHIKDDEVVESPGDDGTLAASSDDDPFKGERPAIAVTPTAGRRETDKIINLETRRARARDTLTPLEQAAFREIGEKLGSSLGQTEVRKSAGEDENPAPDAPIIDDINEPTGMTGSFEQSIEAGPFDTDSPASDYEAVQGGREPDETDSGETDGSDGIDTGRDVVDGSEPDASSDLPDAAEISANLTLPSRHGNPAGLNEGFVDMIPAALLVHIGDRLIHANPEFLEMTGYSSLADFSDAGGLDNLLAEPQREDDRGNVMLRRADGAEIPVSARLRSINWHDSQALMLALSAHPQMLDTNPIASDDDEADFVSDDTENLTAGTVQTGEIEAISQGDGIESDVDAQLRALEIETEELRSILETATDGVVIIGHDNRIRSMNGSACALFGYEEAETRDKSFAMLFSHESQRAVMDYLNGLAEHGVSSVLNDGREVIGHEANGGTLPLFMTIGRLSGSQGYCAVMRDITQWKRGEEELREAKREAETANSHKSDFLARVSHEIRTPLNAIIGFSEMMVEERFGPIGSPRYLEYARDIGSSGKHVLDIVNDLLDISKIEAGQVDLEFGAVSLNEELAECVAMLQPMANSQRVIIRTSLSASVPEVVADGRSVKQIALNLLSNAVRYTPAGGHIVVSTAYEANGSAVLRIRDTGIGMSRNELEQAMKPFGQVGSSARQRGDGTGLGLPLTKAMVEANRAQFDIVSAPKEGTLVTITFPPQRVLAD